MKIVGATVNSNSLEVKLNSLLYDEVYKFLLLKSAPSICNVQRDLSVDGSYTKSVCTVYQDVIYDQAVSICESNGMKIYNADTVNHEKALVSYSDVQWPFGSFWAQGKSGVNCTSFSNIKRLSYFKTESPCTTLAYFHCEYESKIQFFFSIS